MSRTAVILVMLAMFWPQVIRSDVVDDLGSKLLCQCGQCAYLLGNCGMYGCSSRKAMTQKIDLALAEGKNEEAILDDFVNQYTLKVLATPPAEGFNLLVWILPFVGGALGLILAGCVAFSLKKKAALAHVKSSESSDPVILQKVEKELQDFSR